jgi:hypothetical protein
MTRAFGSPNTPCNASSGRKPTNRHASRRRFRFDEVGIQTSCHIPRTLEPSATQYWRGFRADHCPKFTHTIPGRVSFQGIVRIRDRRELFREACRIIVEHGHFTLGWIAVLDHATGKLTAVAQAGLPANAGVGSDLFNVSVALVPGGTAEVALREKHSAIDNAIENAPGVVHEHEPDTLKVRRAAIELGAKSVIALPLFVQRETFGILTLYAPERDFFDDEGIKLLNELAGDISFSLEFIAKEEKADYLAYYDALTGLANRSLFHRSGGAAYAQRRQRRAQAGLVPDRSGAVQEHQRQSRPAGRRRALEPSGGVVDA